MQDDMKITLSYKDYEVLRNGFRQLADANDKVKELQEHNAKLSKANAELTTRQYDNRLALLKAQATLGDAEQSMRRKDNELMHLRRRCETLETQRRSDDREIDALKNDKGKDRATLERLGRELHELKEHYATLFVFLAQKLDTDGNEPGYVHSKHGGMQKIKPSDFCRMHARELSVEAARKAEQRGRKLDGMDMRDAAAPAIGLLERQDHLPPFKATQLDLTKGCPSQRSGRGCVLQGKHEIHESAMQLNANGTRSKLVWIG